MGDNFALGIIYSVLLLTGRTIGMVETTVNNEYLVCKPVAGVYGTVHDENGAASGLRPILRGPAGAPGRPGNTGAPGSRGEPDYAKVSNIIGDEMSTLNARLFQIESEIMKLKSGSQLPPSSSMPVTTQSPEDAQNAKDCMTKYHSPIHAGSTCFRIIGGDGINWSFQDAESNCTKSGGYPADLNSRATYDMIYNYVDRTYSTVVQAWTGMRYENNNLVKTDGSEVNFAKWMAYNPRKSSSTYSSFYRTYTYVYANIDTSSRINGLKNSPSTRKLSYAICHYSLEPDSTTRRSTATQRTTTPYDYYSDEDYY